jgi:AbrB family looped-hinge helix DNA binding protein
MTSIVDDQGRLELPEAVTTQLGLKPGDRVIVETSNGLCVLRPERRDGALHWEGNVLVHRGVGTSPSVAELREARLNGLGEGLAR